VIGWVVDQSHTQPRQISKLCHAQKKLAATSIAFWPVVQVDDELLEFWQFWLPVLPPQKQSVNHEVAGFVVRAEEHK
jgi:hypothetical protein